MEALAAGHIKEEGLRWAHHGRKMTRGMLTTTAAPDSSSLRRPSPFNMGALQLSVSCSLNPEESTGPVGSRDACYGLAEHERPENCSR